MAIKFVMANPKFLTIEQIKELLESGDFDQFIGVLENECLEAKRKRPYDITAIRSLAEFSKDVANIANADSDAYILLGLATTQSQVFKTDEIKSLDLLGENEFYTQNEVFELIKQGVYPKLEIKLKWYPSKNDPKEGLGSLFIEKQPDDKKYFISKVVEVDGEKLKGYFGIPKRKGSETSWLDFAEIQTLAKKVPTKPQEMFIQISNQLDDIKSSLNASPSLSAKLGSPTKSSPSEELDIKIEEALYE